MRTTQIRCRNRDTCPRGTMHNIPRPGERVTTRTPIQARLGAAINEETVEIRPGHYLMSYGGFLHASHEISAETFDGREAWLRIADVQDLEQPEAPEQEQEVPEVGYTPPVRFVFEGEGDRPVEVEIAGAGRTWRPSRCWV